MSNLKRDHLLSQMALESYKDSPSSIGAWNVVAPKQNPQTGFAVCAFHNPQTNEVVIAYRGTDIKSQNPLKMSLADFGDAAADAALARDSKTRAFVPVIGGLVRGATTDWHDQFTEALDYAAQIQKMYPNAKVSVTGHSLGGGLAQTVSKMYGLDGVTFDPAAAQNIVKSDHFKAYAKAHGIPEAGRGRNDEPHNYEVKYSPVSGSTGHHVGRSTDFTGYYADGRAVGSFDVGARHSMERIEGVFASAALKGELPKVAIPDPELTPFVPKFASNEPSNVSNPAIEALKERVTDKTTVAVNGLCDKIGFTDERIRGNLCYGMTDIALNADFTGKGTITAGLNGNNITLIEERSIGDRSYVMGDSAVIGHIDQAVSRGNIAAFKASEQAMKVDDPALAVAIDRPTKACSLV